MSLAVPSAALGVMKHTTMVLDGLGYGRIIGGVVVLAVASGCGVADTEMFGQSNSALVEHMGEACDLEGIGANEIVIEGEDTACKPGYCVGQAGQSWTDEAVDQGICSCRCAGPEGTGPLCDCASGFECRELIKDFGGGWGANVVGAYCVPKG